jgi:serine O-acetyltransferase
MLAWYRLMRFADACGVPLVPMLLSRVIRHLYGAEIHWKADLAPGISIVHGVGLVLSHAAVVGPGCILFQHVTLGESIAPSSGQIGAPRLGARVHVGPGAMLIGPIEIGEGSKVAAGAVLTRSVAPNSLVSPPDVAITSRRGGTSDERA